MANPQKENGYTVTANELIEALMKTKLNGSQFRIVLTVIRYTYGFNKKESDLSLIYIANATGLHKMQIQRELNSLIELNVIHVIKNATFNSTRIIALNKDYETWSVYNKLNSCQLANSLTHNKLANSPVSEIANSPVSGLANQKRNTKENTKEINIGEKKMAPTPKAPKVGDLNFNDLIDSYTTDYTLKETILQFIAHRKEMKKPFKTQYALKLLLNELNKHKDKIAVLNQSIMNGWQGIFELKQTSNYQAPKPTYKQILPDMDNYDPFA